MDKPESYQSTSSALHKILQLRMAQIALENGFERTEMSALETLTEMIESMLIEVGRSARSYCDLAGRATPVLGDIVLAFVSMGVRLRGVDKYKGTEQFHISPPQTLPQPKPLGLLQVGSKQPHPSHVLSHMPAFPDPHTYIRTPTHKQPIVEYEAIREKASTQKRDIEKALTKFLAKTSETESLFEAEDNVFPLIACKPSFPPYLSALNPIDQIFDFEELEYHYLVANRTEDVTSKDDNEENDSSNENEDNEGDGDADTRSEKGADNLQEKQVVEIDNPFLRAVSLPKRAKIEISPLKKKSTHSHSSDILQTE